MSAPICAQKQHHNYESHKCAGGRPLCFRVCCKCSRLRASILAHPRVVVQHVEDMERMRCPQLKRSSQRRFPIQTMVMRQSSQSNCSSEARPYWTRTSRLWTDTSEDHGFNTTTTTTQVQMKASANAWTAELSHGREVQVAKETKCAHHVPPSV